MRHISRGGKRRASRAPVIEALESRRLLSVIYSADMTANPGWTLDNVSGVGWSYGTPAGLGGDPSSGHTGTKVVGTIIASPGYYPDNVPTTYWAKTAAIDCSHYTGVTLDFWRWLGIEGNDRVYLEVSNNGTSWSTLWNNNFSTIVETAWSHQTYDISAAADHQSTVYLHWGLGPTNASVHYCGWNIDDVTVSGTLDTTPPTVSSINTVGATPTNATSVQFAVTFSENVTGVDVSDFALAATGTASGSIASVSGSGSGYSVTVNSVAGDGTLGLNLVDNDSIADVAGNKLGGTGTGNGNFTGQTYTVDHTAPLVSSINRVGTTPTNASSVQFTAAFSESVTGVDASDFALATTGTAAGSLASVTGSGNVYTITVNSVTGDGTLGLNLVDNDTIQDLAGNKLGGTGTGNGNFTGQTYTIDHTPPVVSSIDRVGTSPTNADSVQFAVTFSEFVTGVDINDFALARNHTTGTITSVAGSRNRYTVTVSFVSGNGTLGLNLVDDDSIHDMAGNSLGGTGAGNGNFTGQTYVVDNAAPVITSTTPANYGISLVSAFNVDVQFNEQVQGVDVTDIVLSGRAAASAVVGTPTDLGGNTWRFPVTGATDGGLTLTLAPDAGDITDVAGNSLARTSWALRVNLTPKIIYCDDPAYNLMDIWTMDADGANPVRITNLSYPPYIAERPSYSHDGQSILYTWKNQIWKANADGSDAVQLTDPGGPYVGNDGLVFIPGDYGAVFSPDDTHIAYWHSNGDSDTCSDAIYTMNADGTGTTLVSPWNNDRQMYSPDGTKFVYIELDEANGNMVFSMNVDGTDRTRVSWHSPELADCLDPAYSPDGTKIVFSAAGIGGYGIYVMDAGGSATNCLFSDPGGSDFSPRFSPDGTKIAFTSTRSGESEIYLMNADGTGLTQLTTSAWGSYYPSWGIDQYPPSVVSIARLGSTPTNATSVQFSVSFSESVWGVSASDFALATTGTASGTISAISGSGTTYTVTVNNIHGDGTLGLNLLDDDSIEDRVGNRLGGYGTNNGSFTGPTYALDNTSPTVLSLTCLDANPSNALSVRYALVFSEPVWGLDVSDLSLTKTGSATGSIYSISPTTGGNSSYTITIGPVGGGGTLTLNVVDNDSITDAVGNCLGGTGTGNGSFTGQAYTMDHTVPMATSINRVGSTPTRASSVQWTITFSEAVTGVDLSDFAITATGTAGWRSAQLAGSGSSYTFTVTPSGSGDLTLRLLDDDSIVDIAGNPLGGPGTFNGPFTGQTYTVDFVPPSVKWMVSDPPQSNSILFYVTFSEVVTGVDLPDFTPIFTGTAGGVLTGITGSGDFYKVTVGSLVGDGTLTLSLVDDDTIVDVVGNKLGGTGLGNGNYTGSPCKVDHTAPVLLSCAINSGAAQRSMVTGIRLNFSEIVYTPNVTLLHRDGSVIAGVTFALNTTDGIGFDLTFSGAGLDGGSLPDGSYKLLIPSSSTTDLAGNPLSASSTIRFFRLFGDSNGDRMVDRTDLIAFGQALNKPANYVSYFDYDGDGLISQVDYSQLRKRMVKRLL